MAVMATVLTMSGIVQPRRRSFTGLFTPCSTGPHGNRICRALNRLVDVADRVEIRKDEDGRPAGSVTRGKLHPGDLRINGRIVLNGSLDLPCASRSSPATWQRQSRKCSRGGREAVPVGDKCYEVIATRLSRDNGAEDGDLATMRGQQLHYPQYDHGLPTPRSGTGYVNALCHRSPPSIPVFSVHPRPW